MCCCYLAYCSVVALGHPLGTLRIPRATSHPADLDMQLSRRGAQGSEGTTILTLGIPTPLCLFSTKFITVYQSTNSPAGRSLYPTIRNSQKASPFLDWVCSSPSQQAISTCDNHLIFRGQRQPSNLLTYSFICHCSLDSFTKRTIENLCKYPGER